MSGEQSQTAPAAASIRAAPAGTRHAGLLGVGAYRPVRVVPNDEISGKIDSSDEWIRSRSGIEARRWAGDGETVVAMSIASAGKAMAHAGVRPDQVGVVIVATVSHLYQTPSAASEVAHRIGAAGAAAFDLSAACAGFCYGVAMARDMVLAGSTEYALIVGVERLSDLTDPFDRSTAFIFADGAGAAVVGPAAKPGIGPVVWGSDGSGLDLIRQEQPWDVAFYGGDSPQWPHLEMQGNAVYRWAAYEMAKIAQQALDAAGVSVDDLDAFIPHQANMRITDVMVKALRLPPSVAVARDISGQGNTSAASVPLAMAGLLESGEVTSGDLALIIGFGAGLVYAAQVVRIP